jgi:hypothetical protein
VSTVDRVANAELIRVVQDRIAQNKIKVSDFIGPHDPETRGATGLADDIRKAFYRRDASRLEMLLRVLEDGVTA